VHNRGISAILLLSFLLPSSSPCLSRIVMNACGQEESEKRGEGKIKRKGGGEGGQVRPWAF